MECVSQSTTSHPVTLVVTSSSSKDGTHKMKIAAKTKKQHDEKTDGR